MAETERVWRRRVFYIPGFDPFPPRRYRELYRKEAARQAAISGHEIALAPLKSGRFGWQVEARIEDRPASARIEVLVWSDIVQNSMDTGIAGTYAQLGRTALTYIGSGALGRLMRLRKGPVIAALYPVGVLLGQLALAIALAWLLARGIASLAAPVLPSLAAWLLGGAAGLAAATLLLRWFKRHDGRIYAHYLMHDYAFTASHGGAYPPALEARLAEFRQAIAGALSEEWDEVLVVGHSSGAHLGVSVLADLLRAGQVPSKGPALGFLTLGQVVPMASFLPRAERLRADLNLLAQSEDLSWLDVTAPGDGCAFALCDPVAVSGVAPEPQRWPLVISAAFTQTLSPERWRALRWRFFRLHFQYLCAFDRPGDYDYFAITAGARTLGARFAGRAPSRSRIARPVSRHVSMAAPQAGAPLPGSEAAPSAPPLSA